MLYHGVGLEQAEKKCVEDNFIVMRKPVLDLLPTDRVLSDIPTDRFNSYGYFRPDNMFWCDCMKHINSRVPTQEIINKLVIDIENKYKFRLGHSISSYVNENTKHVGACDWTLQRKYVDNETIRDIDDLHVSVYYWEMDEGNRIVHAFNPNEEVLVIPDENDWLQYNEEMSCRNTVNDIEIYRFSADFWNDIRHDEYFDNATEQYVPYTREIWMSEELQAWTWDEKNIKCWEDNCNMIVDDLNHEHAIKESYKQILSSFDVERGHLDMWHDIRKEGYSVAYETMSESAPAFFSDSHRFLRQTSGSLVEKYTGKKVERQSVIDLHKTLEFLHFWIERMNNENTKHKDLVTALNKWFMLE